MSDADTARIAALTKALRSRPPVSDEEVARAMEFRESVMHGHAEMDPQQAEADRLAGWRRAAGMTPTDVRGGTRGMLSSPTAQAKATEMALGLGPGATVYHGSPHKFEKFDLSKIGTGEGAQAYGHGLYFAENPGVAKSYQYAGMPSYSGSLPKQYVDAALQKSGGNQQAALADLQSQFEALLGTTKYSEGKARQQIQDAINNFKTLASNEVGNLYKVDLPDEHIAKMLDWDKPLSQQPESVREAVAEGMKTHRWPQKDIDRVLSDLEGQRALQYLMPSGNKAQASETLKALGIPGIRYLDAGSRTATPQFRVKFHDGSEQVVGSKGAAETMVRQATANGYPAPTITPAGTSNFVVFDADILKILGTEGEKMMAARERALKP